MTYNLFIDDERYPVNANDTVARSSSEAITIVSKLGLPNHIAFDHDLGGDDTSIKFINWLTDYMLDNAMVFPSTFSYSVHSQNPVGARNIKSYIDNLIKFAGAE